MEPRTKCAMLTFLLNLSEANTAAGPTTTSHIRRDFSTLLSANCATTSKNVDRVYPPIGVKVNA